MYVSTSVSVRASAAVDLPSNVLSTLTRDINLLLDAFLTLELKPRTNLHVLHENHHEPIETPTRILILSRNMFQLFFSSFIWEMIFYRKNKVQVPQIIEVFNLFIKVIN